MKAVLRQNLTLGILVLIGSTPIAITGRAVSSAARV
jgi:CP family cyanate transporter-like MFS transporter